MGVFLVLATPRGQRAKLLLGEIPPIVKKWKGDLMAEAGSETGPDAPNIPVLWLQCNSPRSHYILQEVACLPEGNGIQSNEQETEKSLIIWSLSMPPRGIKEASSLAFKPPVGEARDTVPVLALQLYLQEGDCSIV